MKTIRPFIIFALSIVFSITHAQIINIPGDYPTIQQGIDAAVSTDTVLVAPGIYYENIDFGGGAITVASNFILTGDTNDINNTIINGSKPSNPDNGSVVSFQSAEDTTSVLCGFTITGGTGTYVPYLDIRVSGGIHLVNSGAKIIHNHIEYNTINSNGGGSGGGISAGDAYNNYYYVIIENNRICHNSVNASGQAEGGGFTLFCNAIIKDNIIAHNTVTAETGYGVGAGGWVQGISSPRYINCSDNIIINNMAVSYSSHLEAVGGGLSILGCEGIINKNTIQLNELDGQFGAHGAGIYLEFCSSSLIIENNFINKNTANYDENPTGKGGAMYFVFSNPTLLNNVVIENYASLGAGIYNKTTEYGPTQLINNTIAFNRGGDDGGAIYLEDADMVVLNTILWDNENNEDNEIAMIGSSNIEVAYSDIFDGWSGEGNIDEDPVFEDDSCHLTCYGNNPCIDRGLDDFDFGTAHCYAPETDFEGEIRPMDAGFDIGADESMICTGAEEFNIPNIELLKINPNPCSGTFHLEYMVYETRNLKLELYSAAGVRVKILKQGVLQEGKFKQTFDVSNLPNGLYVIRLESGNKTETSKIVILK